VVRVCLIEEGAMIDIYDYSALASKHGEELDDMLKRLSFICGACGYPKNHKNIPHARYCIIGKLLEIRLKMIPMVINT
jgi:hypothetical protein